MGNKGEKKQWRKRGLAIEKRIEENKNKSYVDKEFFQIMGSYFSEKESVNLRNILLQYLFEWFVSEKIQIIYTQRKIVEEDFRNIWRFIPHLEGYIPNKPEIKEKFAKIINDLSVNLGQNAEDAVVSYMQLLYYMDIFTAMNWYFMFLPSERMILDFIVFSMLNSIIEFIFRYHPLFSLLYRKNEIEAILNRIASSMSFELSMVLREMRFLRNKLVHGHFLVNYRKEKKLKELEKNIDMHMYLQYYFIFRQAVWDFLLYLNGSLNYTCGWNIDIEVFQSNFGAKDRNYILDSREVFMIFYNVNNEEPFLIPHVFSGALAVDYRYDGGYDWSNGRRKIGNKDIQGGDAVRQMIDRYLEYRYERTIDDLWSIQEFRKKLDDLQRTEEYTKLWVTLRYSYTPGREN